jgi:hypothetical protein
MKKTLGDYIVLLIGIIGSFASTIGFGIYIAPELDSQGWVGVAFLGLLAFFFLGYNFYLIAKYRKKVRYSEIFDEINIGFSELHKIDRIDEPSIEMIIQKMGFLCDSLASAFTKINGHNIGICVKYLTFENKRPLVQTLVRDRSSKTNDRKTGNADGIKHFLDLNSDFDFIYSNFDNDNIDTTFYYEPNLPICNDYKNTRLNNNWLTKTKIPFTENIFRRLSWPLKYRSTMVVPIVPILADDQNQKSIRGFLCIDSPREKSFNKQIDVSVLKGVCDGLYNKIDKLNSLIKEQNEN